MWIVQGVPPLGGVKQWWGGENKLFVAKTVGDTFKVSLLFMNNRKLHMRFQLTPRSMTLDDLELYKFEFSENSRIPRDFADFGRNNS